MTSYRYKTGLGQDSHRFLPEGSAKPCIIGGVIFSDAHLFHPKNPQFSELPADMYFSIKRDTACKYMQI